MITSKQSLKIKEFLQELKLKKLYLKSLIKKIDLINKIKNEKKIDSNITEFKKSLKYRNKFIIKYIIDIKFSKSNTLLHIMDFSGTIKFFYSAGLLKYKGKKKKASYQVIRDLLYILSSNKTKFLNRQPIALHLKNVNLYRYQLIKKLRKKFFIVAIKNFNNYPYNGCRNKKVKRNKVRKKSL